MKSQLQGISSHCFLVQFHALPSATKGAKALEKHLGQEISIKLVSKTLKTKNLNPSAREEFNLVVYLTLGPNPRIVC